jgi:hypothetical protein
MSKFFSDKEYDYGSVNDEEHRRRSLFSRSFSLSSGREDETDAYNHQE